MNELWTVTKGKRLRNGFTTGSCGAASAKAAVYALLTGKRVENAVITTPKGVKLYLDIEDTIIHKEFAECSVIKDSGDDPDVTHGIKISVKAEKISEGIEVTGGKGVGRVTRIGLACIVGEFAINPVPMSMIKESAQCVCDELGYSGGVRLTISAENGETIAERTFNKRLGIVGGISILGTTGIVEPMSEKALVDSIRLEIDAKVAAGSQSLLICFGNYGRDFLLKEYGVDLDKVGIKCSNFIGEALDYAAYRSIKKVLIVGHSGKLVKLAAGIMNTHSGSADGRQEIFAAHAAMAGADKGAVEQIMNAVTTDEIDIILDNLGLQDKVWTSISEKIKFHLAHRLKGNVESEFIVFTNRLGGIKKSTGALAFMGEIN